MIIPFDKIPKESRVWIYQSNRKFSEKEITEITNKLKKFLENWTAHGSDLFCSFTIKYNRFIVIALNEKSNKSPLRVAIESEPAEPVARPQLATTVPFTETSTDAPFHPSPQLSCISIV